jgi:hypothetical protein
MFVIVNSLLQQIQTLKGGVKEQPRAIDPAEAPGY